MIVGIASAITSIWLTIKYFRFNRKKNSLGLTGMQIARKFLDDNGLAYSIVLSVLTPLRLKRKRRTGHMKYLNEIIIDVK